MLYVMTERLPSARKYRDVFERIKSSVLEIIAKGQQPRKQVESWGEEMKESCRGLESGMEVGVGGREEFTWMIGEMTGSSAIRMGTGSMIASDNQNGKSVDHMFGNGTGIEDYGGLGNDWANIMVDGDAHTWGAAGKM